MSSNTPSYNSNSETQITFCGTVYNSFKYIRASLSSIINTALKLKKHGINSEIIIVDNFSDDGTWELMNELANKYRDKLRVVLVRYRCSRGLGRNIALHLARGKYLFFSDFDTEYVPDKLANILLTYINNPEVNDKCYYIFITPREKCLNIGGIRDLNRTEDIEFGARLIKECIMLPVLDENLKPISSGEFMREIDVKPKQKFFIQTFTSERRYVKSIFGYLRREFRNKIDMICGMGFTPKKIVLEAYYMRNLSGVKALIWITYHLLFYLIARLMGKRISNNNDIINNGSLCDIAMFLNYIALSVNMMKRYGNESPINVRDLAIAIKHMIKFRGNVIAYFLSYEKNSLKEAFTGKYFGPISKVGSL